MGMYPVLPHARHMQATTATEIFLEMSPREGTSTDSSARLQSKLMGLSKAKRGKSFGSVPRFQRLLKREAPTKTSEWVDQTANSEDNM